MERERERENKLRDYVTHTQPSLTTRAPTTVLLSHMPCSVGLDLNPPVSFDGVFLNIIYQHYTQRQNILSVEQRRHEACHFSVLLVTGNTCF
jgi:hypothetical protein